MYVFASTVSTVNRCFHNDELLYAVIFREPENDVIYRLATCESLIMVILYSINTLVTHSVYRYSDKYYLL